MLHAKELYQIDGVPVNAAKISDFRLIYYMPQAEEQIEEVTTFNPVFLTGPDTSKELDVIVKTNGSLEKIQEFKATLDAIKTELGDYLLDIYSDGKGDLGLLDDWLNQYITETRLVLLANMLIITKQLISSQE